MTQGRRVIEALKKRPMTYWQMLLIGAGLSPWKRAKESLGPKERIVKGERKGLVTWRVVSG